jgi:hypothetical protein
MASYLEPKLTDNEIIEAIRCHYPLEIQKLLVSTKLGSLAEFLEVLKRLELTEERDDIVNVTPRSSHNPQNFQANRGRNYRQEGPGQVRQIHQYDRGRRGEWRGHQGRNSFRRNDNSREEGNERENHVRNRETEREFNPRARRPEVTEEN